MRTVVVAFNFLIAFQVAKAQNIDYAHQIIDTLTSPYFSGRGAVDNGEKKAAKYLASEFERLGLSPIQKSYYQDFDYSINTFPNKMEVKIDNQNLVPGIDFIVGPSCGDVFGTYDLVWYNKDNIPNKSIIKKLIKKDFFKQKYIVIDDKNVTEQQSIFDLLRYNLVGAAGVIILEDKLTQSISTTYNDFGILHILRDKINRNYRKITVNIDQKFISTYTSQNVVASIKGVEHPDSVILLTAHYDHLGKMGKSVFFPGANDNASGVAMLLNLAEYFAQHPPKKTLVFIAFGAEEAGILGSKYFVENPLISLQKINFVFNMDLMGTGDDGATIVNAKVFKRHFKILNQINEKNEYLVELKQRGKAANSDHYWFSEKGIPAFFIYTLGGIKAYHDVDDIAKTLPLTDFEDCFRLIRDFVDEL